MPDFLDLFAGQSSVTAAPGEVLQEEGITRGRLFVLVSGCVEVCKSDVVIAVVDEPGSIFGEMAAVMASPAAVTIRARDTSVFLLSEDAQSMLDASPELVRGIASTLALRLDAVTGYLADLHNQYADRADHLAVLDDVLDALLHLQGRRLEPGSEREEQAPY